MISSLNEEPSKPGISTIPSIVPVGLCISLIKKGAIGGWTGSGQTGAEMVAQNTMTNEVIAMAVDQKTADNVPKQ